MNRIRKLEAYEDTTMQLLEVLDADGNLTCQITDNKTIKEITIKEDIEHWEDVESIPENAEKCNVFISYALITEPIFQDAEKFDYAGVKAVSKNQKIEVWNNENMVYSSSDLNDIVDFLNQVGLQHWEKVNALPEASSSIATLKKFAQPKKQSSDELVEVESWEVYQSNNNFYLIQHMWNDTEECFAIPTNVGEWFLELVKEK